MTRERENGNQRRMGIEYGEKGSTMASGEAERRKGASLRMTSVVRQGRQS